MEFFGGPIKPPFDRDDVDVYGDVYVFKAYTQPPSLSRASPEEVRVPMPKLDREGRLREGPLKGYFPDPFFDRNVWEYQELVDDERYYRSETVRDRLIKIPEANIVVYTVTNAGYVYGREWEEFSQEIYGGVGWSPDDAVRSLGQDPNETGYYYGGQGEIERFNVAETSIPRADLPSNARFIQPSQR